MTRLTVKICGITRVEDARMAVEAGADAIGLVFAESPRRVNVAVAREIIASLSPSVRPVAVFRDAAASEIDALRLALGPIVVQLDYAAACAPGVTGPLLPVLRDGQPVPRDWRERGCTALYEGRQSGAGELADWTRAATLSRRSPLFLAGGLTPDNVARAIRDVRPRGVDVSSGVEASPGIKDPERVRLFVRRVRRAERELEAC